MKFSKNKKTLNFNKDFVVYGSKKDLLKFEKLLQLNGIHDDKSWNKMHRKKNIASIY